MGNWEIDALMPALKQREPAALEQLYDLCVGRAFSLAYRILGDHGVAESRLSPHGYGKTDFVATNKTREGRAQNRRVELVPNQ